MNYNINNINGKMESLKNNSPSPLEFNMGNGVLGSYDNLRLKTTCNDSWRKPPCDPSLKNNKLFVPQGNQLPLKSEVVYSELPENSMFMFGRSYSSPLCCPSTLSTDRGCVCTTSEQRRFIGENRGNNKNSSNYSF